MMPCRSSKDSAVWRPHHSLHLPAVEVSPGEDLQLPPVVAGHPVLAAPVHVDGGQVHPELLPRLLEQVVGDLLGDGVVHGLGHLVEEAAQVLVRPARPVQVVGLLQELAQLLAACVAVRRAPPLHRARQQGVPEPEGLADEAVGGAGVGLGVVAVEISVLHNIQHQHTHLI